MENKNHLWYPMSRFGSINTRKIVSSEKNYLIDENGNKMFDATGGWWTNIHGFYNKEISQTITEQALKLPHVRFSDLTHEPAEKLAQKIIEKCKIAEKVFFAENGSSAVDAAMKMCIRYWQLRGNRKKKFFGAFKKGYHGETFGAMSLGSSSGFFDQFESCLLKTHFSDFPETWIEDNDAKLKEEKALIELEDLLSKTSEEMAAFFIEPLVQGAAGMRFCSEDFLRKAAKIIQDADVLLVCDEIMTGFGRLGTMFASDLAKIYPDLICIGKGMSGGYLPISAVCSNTKFAQVLESDLGNFPHGNTYAGNPICCATALKSMELIESDKILDNVAKIEKLFASEITSKWMRFFNKVRCRGALMAADLPMKDFQKIENLKNALFANKNIMIRPIGETIYVAPSCSTSPEIVSSICDNILEVAIDMFSAEKKCEQVV